MRRRRDPSLWQRGTQVSHELHSSCESDTDHLLIFWQAQRCYIFRVPVRKMEDNKSQVRCVLIDILQRNKNNNNIVEKKI